MTARPEPRRISPTEFRDKIASGEIAIWCYCYDSPEPAGWWAPPDDEHADICCIDHIRAAPMTTDSAARRPCENGRHNFGWPPRPPAGVEPLSCQCQRLMLGYYRDNGEAFVYVVTTVEAAP